MEFPGCVAQGDTISEAHERLEQAAEDWIRVALDLGQDIPPPAEEQTYSGRILVRLPKSLHRRAAEAAGVDGTSLNQFIVAAVAERVGASGIVKTSPATAAAGRL
jgi:predicted HicB family RNase H-like nuclease